MLAERGIKSPCPKCLIFLKDANQQGVLRRPRSVAGRLLSRLALDPTRLDEERTKALRRRPASAVQVYSDLIRLSF